MTYDHIRKGIFKSRPNRFIAHVSILSPDDVCGQTVICHVKNTGRCRELLLPGAAVLLQFHPQAAELGRKTEYSLIGVYKTVNGRSILINMDSQAPNQAAWEWLNGKNAASYLSVSGFSKASKDIFLLPKSLRREVTYGLSRFDLAFELGCRHAAGSYRKPAFMEVKGVTLEENGIAMFPDAPTKRGVRHILELAKAVSEGYEAYLLFVIQMKGIREFRPNRKTHPQFGDALCAARDAGVHILAFDCTVTEDSLNLDEEVKVKI